MVKSMGHSEKDPILLFLFLFLLLKIPAAASYSAVV